MRAVVLDADGLPGLAEVPDPAGPGDLVRVLACGLCGSDVEKLGRGARRARCSGTRSTVCSKTARASPSCTVCRAATAIAVAPGTSRRATSSSSCASSPAGSPSGCARPTSCPLGGVGLRRDLGRAARAASSARRSACRAGECWSSAAARSGSCGCRCCAGAATRSSPRTCAPTASRSAMRLGAIAATARSTPPSSLRTAGLNDALARVEPGGTVLVFAAPAGAGAVRARHGLPA